MADLPHHNFPRGNPIQISSMAYQYHSMNPGLDQNMMPSYDHHMEPIRSHSPLHGQVPSSSNRDLEASLSKSSKDSKGKRSMSTPNIRTSTNTDAAALALVNDKRRNKLGYHRTSVACGHCRRRKIRCIAAPADPQNRCSNCIRLKKECNFYPVDQQPQPEPKRRGSKAQSGTGGASRSSSPSIPPSQLPDMQSNLPYNLNMPAIQNLGGTQSKKERTESFSPENKVITSSRNFDYNGGHTAWMAPEVSPGTKTPADLSGSCWSANSQETPMTPGFSPYPTPNMHMTSAQNWQSRGHHGQPEANPREPEWPAPQRSVSYGNLEGMQNSNQHAAYGLPQPTQSYTSARTHAHNGAMYPPNITTTHPHSAAEISSASTIGTAYTHSATPMSAGSYTGWNQPYPGGYAKVSAGVDTYASWNGGQGGERIMEEEESAAGYGGYGDSGGGVYYASQPHAAGR
ncbi:hypothetical protein NHQ30_009161 [Ciborinia camelliae]|nr:hypothetical protein NHQ30_009161 [Ciborinia camelliae]